MSNNNFSNYPDVDFLEGSVDANEIATFVKIIYVRCEATRAVLGGNMSPLDESFHWIYNEIARQLNLPEPNESNGGYVKLERACKSYYDEFIQN